MDRTMQAFWDVLWADAKALLAFAGPMLLACLPTSALGGLFGAVRSGLGSWAGLRWTIWRVVWMGTAAALVLSMLIELAFHGEGLSAGRRALRDYATVQLLLIAPCFAFAAGFFAARRYAPASLTPPRRRFALWQLFAWQLIVGLLLGWWVFTRRDEIRSRGSELSWQARQAALDQQYGLFGWRVETWRDREMIVLHAPNFTQQPVLDEDLAALSPFSNVVGISIRSDAVTDIGVKHVSQIDGLGFLYVESKQLGDACLATLAEHPHLRQLRIDSPHITGEGLKRLAKSKSIRQVSIHDSSVTADDVREVRELRPDIEWNVYQGMKRVEPLKPSCG